MTVSIQVPGTRITRLASAAMAGRGDPLIMEGFAHGQKWFSEEEAIRKGITTPNSMADASAALRPYLIDLAEASRPLSIHRRMPLIRTAPMRVRLIVESGGAVASFVDEGAPAPMSAATFNSATTIEPAKVIATIIQTQELVEMGLDGAQDLLRNDLVAACAQAENEAFARPDNAGGNGRPKSITHDGVQIASTGNTLAAVDADLRAMFNAHIAAGNSMETAIVVGSPKWFTYLASLRGTGGDVAFPQIGPRGGAIWGVQAIASASCAMGGSPTEAFAFVAEQDQIVFAEEALMISATREAAVQANDAPSAGGQQLLSLWQNGLVGVKVERWMNWRTRRNGAATSITSINI